MVTRNAYLEATLETRTMEETQQKLLSGYFIKFNSKTELWDGFYEQFSPECIANLVTGDIRALFNHDTSLVLGRTGNGTLTLECDHIGLRGTIAINDDDPQAVGIYARVKRGDVIGCSVGFIPLEIETLTQEDGSILEIMKKIELFEVSPCTFPAYPQTEISARQKDWEKLKEQQLLTKKKELKERYKHE